jgi:hypothetical protein
MTSIATKNGSIIVKDGSVAENCNCCGGVCVNSTRVTRADMWFGSQSPPDAITVRISHSDVKRKYVEETQISFNTFRYFCGQLWSDPSRDATYTLAREVFNPGRGGDGHCRYYGTGDLGALSITPGVSCGGGWGATIASLINHVVYATQQNTLFLSESLPAADNTSTFMNQSEPSICGDISGTWQQTYQLNVQYYPDPGTIGGYYPTTPPYQDRFTYDAPAYFSDQGCLTPANSTLSGMTWVAWAYPYTYVKLGSSAARAYMVPFRAATISVV